MSLRLGVGFTRIDDAEDDEGVSGRTLQVVVWLGVRIGVRDLVLDLNRLTFLVQTVMRAATG